MTAHERDIHYLYNRFLKHHDKRAEALKEWAYLHYDIEL